MSVVISNTITHGFSGGRVNIRTPRSNRLRINSFFSDLLNVDRFDSIPSSVTVTDLSIASAIQFSVGESLIIFSSLGSSERSDSVREWISASNASLFPLKPGWFGLIILVPVL